MLVYQKKLDFMKIDRSALSPEELMKSRYDAFVRQDWSYLVKTSTNQTLEELSGASDIKWLKLNIINSYDNIVEFKAYYKENNKTDVLHEKSTFIQENGMWKYQDGELYNSKIERNEPCPCGSGKKFKRCCA
ncbi:MAG: SEC-C domain-containing protein [Sulfurimonas sp.]|nr:SEC-C domain-containing protein [Sulfurimonas sp.]